MCGLAGDIDLNSPPGESAMTRMLAELRHRGPDGGAQWHDGPVRLGHRRLSVIDPLERSGQPMVTPDGRWVIVFNGEIYNFRELRRDLESEGEVFTTSGDTEVLLRLLALKGTAGLQRLNGMFAFAIWDRREQSLFAARDRFGEKPFLYWERPHGAGIVFASELRALGAHGGVPCQIDRRALSIYLANNYVCGEDSILLGIRRLPAAHWLTFSASGGIRTGCYWDLAAHFLESKAETDEPALMEELRALVDDAVRLRLVADVGLGAFLSGGVDSSIIVSSMVNVTGTDVRAFSMGFDEAGYSELPKARRVARQLGVSFCEQQLSADLSRDLPQIANAADEPFADTSFVPTYYLSRFAREHVTVSLSGDGGDELFCGYETYVASTLKAKTGFALKQIAPLLAKVSQSLLPTTHGKVSFDYKARQFIRGLGLSDERAHWFWRNIHDEAGRRSLLKAGVSEFADADGFDLVATHFERARAAASLDRLSYVDIKTWLVDDVLHKVDRASMAHALEVRAPFLDHRIAAFAARLAPGLKLRGRQKKVILRRAFSDRFPPGTLDQRKEGFNAPVSHWINGPLKSLAQDVFASQAFGEVFDRGRIAVLQKEHAERRADHGMRLFNLLMFGLWRDKFPVRTSI